MEVPAGEGDIGAGGGGAREGGCGWWGPCAALGQHVPSTELAADDLEWREGLSPHLWHGPSALVWNRRDIQFDLTIELFPTICSTVRSERESLLSRLPVMAGLLICPEQSFLSSSWLSGS